MRRFAADPLGHVRFSYQWGEGELSRSKGPRAWQADILDTIGQHLRGANRFQPLQIAVTSGHGIGKSALIAQIVKWAMDTCVDCRCVVTANTDTQLRTKTWPEIAKWSRLAITKGWFRVTATSVIVNDPDHEREWKADAVPWSENNTEAFQGLHNEGKRIVLIFDEASAIADKVWEVAEGAMTDKDTEILWIAFGNPTRSSGRFRECFRRFQHRWVTKQIDSRTVEGTNAAQFKKLVDDYGEDSDIVKIRVRGLFPTMSALQYFNEADVDAAYGRHLRPGTSDSAPVILTLDNSWQGDDPWVIGKRQGLDFKILRTGAKNDNDVAMANMLAFLANEHNADAVFVDMGYGTGVVSVGRTLGHDWQLVDFGSAAIDKGCLNKRAEMHQATKKWLQEGGAIEADPQFRDEFLSIETVPRMDGKLQIEAKHDMKARGLPSPNKLDALNLSFAYPVRKRDGARGMATRDDKPYDPRDSMDEWRSWRRK
jgi:hypothetical protein